MTGPEDPTGPDPAVSCPVCGTPNPRGFRFCGACGATVGRVCSTCGAEVPSGFRFCGVCGSPQAAGDIRLDAEIEERKVVTVLFADLTASTELAARLDPEDLRAVLRRFFEAMVQEIERLDGTVEKFIGDAVVAVFGVPAAHEDDPERAVRAALAMQRRLSALNEDAAGSSGVELGMRIGVNTGEVVTATGVDRENLVTGEPVNVAARFQALAAAGGIVVGERTYRDTRQVIAYRSLGEVQVKGIDRPLPAYEVTGELDGSAGPISGPGSVGAAPLVGRDAELELLELLFSRTLHEGRASLVTVVGPAGIGKSRLAHEFGQRVRSTRPLGIVRGRCLPYGEGLTYWPMAEILKADAGILDSDQPEAILDKAASVLQGRFGTSESSTGTVQVLLSSIGVPVHPDPLAGAEPAAAKELIARSWKAYFESLASEQPVLALLEDLHWADVSLLDLVEYLAARVARRVMFVAMARPDLAERRPGWSGGLRSSTTVSLSPLSSEDGEHMIRHLLDELPAPSEAIHPLLARAEGNPFYAQELLRMVIESGSLVRSNGEWVLERPLPATLPDTVQGVIASRIDMLPAQEKRILQDAAVVGRIFWPGAVERLGSSAVQSTIDTLVDKGLVWQRDSSVVEAERELIFNHILTRDVAYASIPKARRAAAHAEALSWIEEKTAGRDEEFAEVLAFHAEQAGDLGRTARYSMLAGHRSRRLFAAQEAIQRYDRALEAAQSGSGSIDHPLVAEIALSRGEARELLGQFVEAQADYERALVDARAANHGHLEAQSMAALAHLHWLQDRFEEGEAILSDALEKARSAGDDELLARLLYTAGTLRFGRGQYREALPMHEEALRVAQARSDLAGEALARHGLCETLYFLGPLEHALAEGRRADKLFRSLGQRPMVYHNLYMVGYVLFFKGRLSEALEAFDEAVEGCRELGNRRDEGFALGRAIAKFPAGQLGAALADMQEAVRIAVEIRTPRLELAMRGFRTGLLGELRRFDLIEPELRECFALAERLQTRFAIPRLFTMAGWLAVHRGKKERAREFFKEGWERADGVPLDLIQNGQLEILAWEEAEDPDELRGVAEKLGRLAGRESELLANWAEYGLLAAAALTDQLEGTLERARSLQEWARSTGERMLEWRAARIASRILIDVGRLWDADIERVRAATILNAMAEGLDDEGHRSSFIARPDVSALLDSGAGPLADLASESLEALEPPAERRFADGEAIFRRGDPGTTVYIVAEGAVSLVVTTDDGNEVFLGRMVHHDVFGEVGLLDGGPRTADAVAEGSTVVFEFGREAFLRLLQAEPTVAGRMLSLLNERLAESSRVAEQGENGDVAARLAGAIQQVATAEDRGGTVIEVLPVYLRDGEIWWLRPSTGTSLQVEGDGSGHPGDAVVSALAAYGVHPVAVHSTSWRFERGRLVVTYLAVLDVSDPSVEGFQATEVRRRELARGTAFDPPPSIEIDHVVEHALRHLAWLGRDDPVIKDLLHGGWFRALEVYEPEPFRSLTDTSSTGA
jgi:class 3 adenylate cyclase/CRP-like cAMP-binding protein/tetratricopeptide (TPR) repeat protein